VAIYVAPGHAGNTAAGIARLANLPLACPPPDFGTLAMERDTLVVLAHFGDDVVRSWLSPALSALTRGTIAGITVIAANGAAVRYDASRPSWWRRLTTRA